MSIYIPGNDLFLDLLAVMRQTSNSMINTTVLPTAIPETERAFFHVPLSFEDDISGAGSTNSYPSETDANIDGENEVEFEGDVDGDIDDVTEGLTDCC